MLYTRALAQEEPYAGHLSARFWKPESKLKRSWHNSDQTSLFYKVNFMQARCLLICEYKFLIVRLAYKCKAFVTRFGVKNINWHLTYRINYCTAIAYMAAGGFEAASSASNINFEQDYENANSRIRNTIYGDSKCIQLSIEWKCMYVTLDWV